VIARFAHAAEEAAPNGRLFWWAYYRGVSLPRRVDAQIWPADPDGAVVVPAGNGLHLVGAFASKLHYRAAFASDRPTALERYVAELPDAPDLSGAERVSAVIGTNDYPFVKRDPLPAPGVALIGDAAMASDPLPAVGCGWAFRSAEWLVDAALAGEVDRYRSARAEVEEYDALARLDAGDPSPAPMQVALRRAARDDRELARRLGMFAMRAAPPSVLLNPDTFARAQAYLATETAPASTSAAMPGSSRPSSVSTSFVC
jgi:flavin-dependent dehydrogenase